MPQQRLQVTNRAEEQIGAYVFHQEGHYVRDLTASLSYLTTSLLTLALGRNQALPADAGLPAVVDLTMMLNTTTAHQGFRQHPLLLCRRSLIGD